jgi:hypothetical protein
MITAGIISMRTTMTKSREVSREQDRMEFSKSSKTQQEFNQTKTVSTRGNNKKAKTSRLTQYKSK